MRRWRVTWTGYAGSPYVSTFYTDGDGTSTNLTTDRNAIVAFLEAVDTAMSNSLAWELDTEVDVMDLDGTVTGTVSVSSATGSGGTAGAQLPHADQLLLRLRTGTFLSGREIRGKIFLPGNMAADATSVGAPTSSRLSTVNTAAATLITATGNRWSVWSRKAAARASVSSASGAPFYAVLRSRRD